MQNRIRTIHHRSTSRQVRGFVRVEQLESRSLLAGLINVGDSLLPLDTGPVVAVAAEVRHEVIQDNAANQGRDLSGVSDTDLENDICHHGDGEHDDEHSHGQDGECLEAELKNDQFSGTTTEPADRPDISVPPAIRSERGSEKEQQAPIEVKESSNWLSSFATSMDSGRSRLSFDSGQPSSASETRADRSSSFRYFVASNQAVHDPFKSLDAEPLMTDAVRNTFFAHSLLERSGLQLREGSAKSSTDSMNKESHVASNDARFAVSGREVASGETSDRNNDMTMMDENDVADQSAIAAAEEALRIADHALASSLLDPAAIDVAIAQEFVEQTGVAIAQTQGQPATIESRLASAPQGWQVGFFSVVSLVISVRTSPLSKKSQDTTTFRSMTRYVRSITEAPVRRKKSAIHYLLRGTRRLFYWSSKLKNVEVGKRGVRQC
ncbi:hypothetical protein Pla22_48130 [Rubripirellula amarantea]|uniref:Uncharacterized protein n=1 Tax=Rubripirellula amarantea TaxID=2527999 RepID=A0A5C5WFI5_9BACT|nr:hypothetical protein [Rubripirellula amarantea]TWT49616.1 hypothetical protein Pla22_48130 [Rubripirellula amarantea]